MSTAPNPGLSADVNRYLASLDKLLPRRSRKGDRAAQLLDSALNESAAAHAPVGEALSSFLQECENFHRMRFWADPDFRNHDDGNCWLPLVLVGHAWAECLCEIMRISLPDSIGRARRIVLKPIGKAASHTVRAVLRKSIPGVTEAAYNRFVSQVKPVAPRLETVYDPDTSVLDVKQGLDVEVRLDEAHSALVPVNGGMPVWLGALLDLNAVEELTLCYPLVTRDVPTVAECVSMVLILPDCPVEWRSKEKFPERDALALITEALGQGFDEPFHLYVTAVETEWLPLVDAFVARATATSPACKPEVGTEQSDLLVRHLGRLLTLHPALDMRADGEYPHLIGAFAAVTNQPNVLVPAASIAALPADAAASILKRLDDVRYVTAWARHFQARARAAIDALVAAAPVSAKHSAPLPRGVSGEFLVRVNASVRDFASCILAAIDNSLDVLIANETHVLEARSTQLRNQRMCIDFTADATEGHDGGEADALKEIARLSLTLPATRDRARALAALIYSLTEHDVLKDSEPYGRIDDGLVIASLLTTEDMAHDPSPAALAWVRSLRGRIDGMAARPVQDQILARYEQIVDRLTALCDRNPTDAQPAVAATKKRPGRQG